jgi:hypothetical protein
MYLHLALKRLFNDYHNIGYWDDELGRLHERLTYDSLWQWKYQLSDKMKYSVFCLSNILIAKDLFNLNTIEYDVKIKNFINYIYSNKDILTIEDLSYGALTSLVLGKKLYNQNNINITEITNLFDFALEKILNRNDNQDSLILIAGKYLNDISPNSDRLRKLKLLIDRYLESQNAKGSFETGDIRAVFHQRNMYVLWGLIFSSYFYIDKVNEIKKAFEKSINWIWENNRDEKDDAFYWHSAFYWIKCKYGFKIPIYNQTSSRYLFECHQTFFCNSINFYRKRFNDNRFNEEMKRAMEWIFGKNRINKDLTVLTGIDLPIRIMDISNNLFIKNQQFKGSYEVGSYILALAGNEYFKMIYL